MWCKCDLSQSNICSSFTHIIYKTCLQKPPAVLSQTDKYCFLFSYPLNLISINHYHTTITTETPCNPEGADRGCMQLTQNTAGCQSRERGIILERVWRKRMWYRTLPHATHVQYIHRAEKYCYRKLVCQAALSLCWLSSLLRGELNFSVIQSSKICSDLSPESKVFSLFCCVSH